MGYTIEPLGEHIAVKQADPRPLITATGVVLPSTAEETPDEGIIYAVGTQIEDVRLQVGVRVAFSKYAGSEIRIDLGDGEETELLLLSEKDLLAIITETSNEDIHPQLQPSGDASHSENTGDGRCIP